MHIKKRKHDFTIREYQQKHKNKQSEQKKIMKFKLESTLFILPRPQIYF